MRYGGRAIRCQSATSLTHWASAGFSLLSLTHKTRFTCKTNIKKPGTFTCQFSVLNGSCKIIVIQRVKKFSCLFVTFNFSVGLTPLLTLNHEYQKEKL